MTGILFRSTAQEIIKLSFPIILGQLANVLLGLTDTIMLGQYGKAELAAVGISNQIFFVVSVIGMGVMTALTPIIAASKGASNKKECGEFLRSGIELSFFISLVVCILVILISANFEILRQEASVNRIAGKYLRIMGVSVFPMLLFLALKHFTDGLSYSRPAVIITFIGVGINFILNWILIYGNLSFPALGATGAGIATLAARIIMALLLVITVFYSSSLKLYLPPLISTYNTVPVIKKLIRLGFPTGLQIFFETGTYALAAVFIGWISVNALAAHQIAMGIVAVFYMIASGVSAAGSVKVANAFGQKDPEAIKRNGTMAIIVAGGFMTLNGLSLIIFNQSIFSLFTTDTSVQAMISDILKIIILFQLVNGIQVASTGVLRAIEDVKPIALLTLLTYWVIGIPLAYLLSIKSHMGLKGVWVGLLVALIINAIFVLARTLSSISETSSHYYSPELNEKPETIKKAVL